MARAASVRRHERRRQASLGVQSSTSAPPGGGAALLVDETAGFGVDFTHPVDAERVAVKT